MTTFNIFHTTRVRIGVRDAPHIWGAGEIRDAGEWRLFGGLARSEPFVTPHVWGTGEMSTEISATYLGRCGNKHWKSRRIYVALGHDELSCARQILSMANHFHTRAVSKMYTTGLFLVVYLIVRVYSCIAWHAFLSSYGVHDKVLLLCHSISTFVAFGDKNQSWLEKVDVLHVG